MCWWKPAYNFKRIPRHLRGIEIKIFPGEHTAGPGPLVSSHLRIRLSAHPLQNLMRGPCCIVYSLHKKDSEISWQHRNKTNAGFLILGAMDRPHSSGYEVRYNSDGDLRLKTNCCTQKSVIGHNRIPGKVQRLRTWPKKSPFFFFTALKLILKKHKRSRQFK